MVNLADRCVFSEQQSVAATQFACTWDAAANLRSAERVVREAAGRGAQIILLQELFETPYFCIEQDARHFALATTLEDNPAVRRFAEVARELGVVLPVSFFERAGQVCFNSVAIIDADGRVLGVYRKSHIPNGPGYQEKYYFRPGNTGFKVWEVFGTQIGVGICWDQWYPECARAMALMGAELLFYPTAIGAEPQDATLDTRHMWRRAMVGHAVSNCMPVIAANRIEAHGCAVRHERMHRVLKQETTRPPAINMLQQQDKFEHFMRVYNYERPHEGIEMKIPGDLYRPSSRQYTGLPELAYPFHDRTIVITECGRICMDRKKIMLSSVLAGQRVGVMQVEDQIWQVSFMDYDLGYFDMDSCRLEPGPNPFGPRVLTM